MDLWHKGRSFAEEAAKRSQELTIGSSKLSGIVSDTAKRCKEIAAEASRRSQVQLTNISSSKLSDLVSETAKLSKEIAVEASKRADQIKYIAEGIKPLESEQKEDEEKELESFGVTEELREFVKEITITTFRDFPLQDDTEMSDVATVSNVRQDLTDWQAKHASLVLSTVKEISKLRYELCPRVMKDRKFWRIYFILVNSHIAAYEKRYIEEAKSVERIEYYKAEELQKFGITSGPEAMESNQQSRILTSSPTEQDLDVFLLGGDSDEGPDDDANADGGFDDDFDKMDSSDDEKVKV